MFTDYILDARLDREISKRTIRIYNDIKFKTRAKRKH